MNHELDNVTTVAAFAAKYPSKFSESKIRWWIYRAKVRKGARGDKPANGFEKCFRRVEGEIFILEDKVWAWINGSGNVDAGGSNEEA